MLEPHRFMNLDFCLINVASLIVDCLLQRDESSLDELLSFSNQFFLEINESDITQAISFLYLVGKVDYCTQNDLISLKK